MTLPQLIDRLTLLAREHDADLCYHVQTEFWGSSVQLYWSPRRGGHDDVPRQVTASFKREMYQHGFDEVKGPDLFERAEVIDVHLWLWAVDEGLDLPTADSFATRIVETVDAVEAYLLNQPYKHTVRAKSA